MGSQKAAVSGVIVAQNVDIVASDWNNRIRDAVIKISSKIPEVGGVVSVLIGFFWPQDKIDIFQALKADITKLVKKEILEYELNLHQSEINALKVLIKRYQAAKTHEKGNFLSNWITEADRLSAIFQQSKNNIHLIPLVITLALFHLTGLRERLDFGKELYDEDNTKQWKEDLEDMYKTYIVDFLPDIFKKWKVWRAEQVEIKAWTEPHPTAIPPSFGWSRMRRLWILSQVIVREWNTIDAMQFVYVNRRGFLAGNAQGGRPHDIDVTGKPINELRMGFSNGVLTYVQILYYDGTSSSSYGNRSGWKCAEVSAKGPPAYSVSSWSYKVDNGPSNSYGPSVIQLEYAAQVE